MDQNNPHAEISASLGQMIGDETFPCIMAKAALNNGLVRERELNLESAPAQALEVVYSFVREYRKAPDRFSSLILSFDTEAFQSFSVFETFFWNFTLALHDIDKVAYRHDPRVGADPAQKDFSYSLMEEAFFLIMLHPQSPRVGRRYKYPAIVFNPHQQFERLREKGVFAKIRDTIRERDLSLQNEKNIMLGDFGQGWEIFQYTGRQYTAEEMKITGGQLRERFIKGPKLANYIP